MTIFRYYEFGVTGNGAVYKFVIVGIRHNQMEPIVWSDEDGERIIGYHVKCQLCKSRTCLLL